MSPAGIWIVRQLQIPPHGAPELPDLPPELLTDTEERRRLLAALRVEALVLGQGRRVALRPGPGLGYESGASSGAGQPRRPRTHKGLPWRSPRGTGAAVGIKPVKRPRSEHWAAGERRAFERDGGSHIGGRPGGGLRP